MKTLKFLVCMIAACVISSQASAQWDPKAPYLDQSPAANALILQGNFQFLEDLLETVGNFDPDDPLGYIVSSDPSVMATADYTAIYGGTQQSSYGNYNTLIGAPGGLGAVTGTGLTFLGHGITMSSAANNIIAIGQRLQPPATSDRFYLGHRDGTTDYYLLEGKLALAQGSREFKVNAPTILGDTLTVTGAITAPGAIFTDEDASVIIADGGISASDSIDAPTISAVDGDIDDLVVGLLDVADNATIGVNLTVGDNATVGDALDVSGNTTIGGTIDIVGNATIGGNAGVLGLAATSHISTGQTFTANGAIYGRTSLRLGPSNGQTIILSGSSGAIDTSGALSALSGAFYGLTVYKPAVTPVFSVSSVGTISAHSNKITSVATPTANTDAATKGYVDGLITGGSGYMQLPGGAIIKWGSVATSFGAVTFPTGTGIPAFSGTPTVNITLLHNANNNQDYKMLTVSHTGFTFRCTTSDGTMQYIAIGQ